MDFKELIRIFITGIVLGNGPCLAYCLPIILPIILTTSGGGMGEYSGWYTGLKLSVLFSISRLMAYSLLGFLSVTIFRLVNSLIGEQGVYMRFALGVVILIIGILYILGKELNPVCNILNRYIAEKSSRNLFIIGLIIGLSPCAPLAAVLTYIAAMSPNSLAGLVQGLAFGLGTVITLLIPLGTFTGFVSQQLKKLPGVFKLIRITSGIVLIYLGYRLITFGFIQRSMFNMSF